VRSSENEFDLLSDVRSQALSDLSAYRLSSHYSPPTIPTYRWCSALIDPASLERLFNSADVVSTRTRVMSLPVIDASSLEPTSIKSERSSFATMRSARITLMAVLATATTATVGQAVPPTEGYQLGDPSDGADSYDVIMPLTVAQCEPVLIYYNFTLWPAYDNPGLTLFPPIQPPIPLIFAFASFQFPNDVGYFEWICNIPAGKMFVAVSFLLGATYVVQPGSSSACLGPLTTTYNSDLQYFTSEFASFTATSYPLNTASYSP
jgi:hypothetical protein